MATIRQKRLANAIVQNSKKENPLNKKELLVSVGYAPSTADVNQNGIMQQIGVKEELAVLGFDEKSAMKVVQQIMNNEDVDPSARLKATDQVFKVQGTYAPEKQAIVHAFILPDDEKSRIDNILEDNASDQSKN